MGEAVEGLDEVFLLSTPLVVTGAAQGVVWVFVMVVVNLA